MIHILHMTMYVRMYKKINIKLIKMAYARLLNFRNRHLVEMKKGNLSDEEASESWKSSSSRDEKRKSI